MITPKQCEEHIKQKIQWVLHGNIHWGIAVHNINSLHIFHLSTFHSLLDESQVARIVPHMAGDRGPLFSFKKNQFPLYDIVDICIYPSHACHRVAAIEYERFSTQSQHANDGLESARRQFKHVAPNFLAAQAFKSTMTLHPLTLFLQKVHFLGTPNRKSAR